jgi:hypothetical protein
LREIYKVKEIGDRERERERGSETKTNNVKEFVCLIKRERERKTHTGKERKNETTMLA